MSQSDKNIKYLAQARRFLAQARRFLAIVWAGASSLTSPIIAHATPVNLTAIPIETFQGRAFGEVIESLIWQGGIELIGPEQFGGISGVTFTGPEELVMISDQGQFIYALLRSDNGHPVALDKTDIFPVRNSRGAPLPPNYSRDAEAIDTIYRQGEARAVRVGFENLTRVADFELIDSKPEGAATEVVIPHWLSDLRSNTSIESVCIAPDTSPISGSTLLITEDFPNSEGAHSGWILGDVDKGPISLSVSPGFNPTDCAFLPNGDLLVLERGTGFLSFNMQLRRIAAPDVHKNSVMDGKVILTGSGSDIDNMEALAVRTAPDGSTRITLISDNNFNSWERTVLLEFELIEIQG